jgi:spore germination protein
VIKKEREMTLMNEKGKYKRLFFIATFLFVFLSGCVNDRIIDKIQIIQTLAYDIEGDKVKGMVIYPIFAEKGITKLKDFKTVSTTIEDILPRLDTKSAYPMEIGKLDMVLFGNDFAKRGVADVLISLSKDPIAGSRMQVGITEHTAEELLKSSESVQIPFHLSDKINHNIEEGNLPKMNLQVFLRNYYTEGRDSYLPYLIIEQGQVKIDGLALLRNGQYIHHINMRQAFILKMLMEGFKNGNYKTKIKANDKEVSLLLRNLSSKVTYTIDNGEPIPGILIDVTLNAQVRDEPAWLHLSGKTNITEKILSKYFNDEISDLVSLFQKYNVDPIGLGDKFRAHSRNWDFQKFRENYPKLKTKVHTHVHIVNTGIVK